MNRRLQTRQLATADTEDADPMPENGPDSPSSGDDNMVKTTEEPSPKKSKRGVQKRVVSVPIGDVEGCKSKGEAYPPSDSWAWRKYGQKPIKGSPYPRGYYRCSSSKGCPARKQVERSRVDPTTLIITYACEHNHPVPTKSHSSTSVPSSASATATATATTMSANKVQAEETLTEEIAVFSGEPDLEIGDGMLGGYHHHHRHQWFDDVASMAVLESPIFGGAYVDADVSSAFSAVSGEDESLFADLGELPECSVVFRRRIVEPEEQNRRCGLSAVTG